MSSLDAESKVLQKLKIQGVLNPYFYVKNQSQEGDTMGYSRKILKRHTVHQNPVNATAMPPYDDDEMEQRFERFMKESGLPEDFGADTDTSSDSSDDEDVINELLQSHHYDESNYSSGFSSSSDPLELASMGSLSSFTNSPSFSTTIKEEFHALTDFDDPFSYMLSELSSSQGSLEENFHQCTNRHCRKSFKNPISLKQHMMSHQDLSRIYVCCECTMRFETLKCLRDHVTLQHKEQIESRKFRSVFDFDHDCEKHTKRPKHHENVCNICHKKLGSENKLKKHMAQHTDPDRPYVCKVCYLRFKAIPYLKGHYTKHHPDSVFRKKFVEKTGHGRSQMRTVESSVSTNEASTSKAVESHTNKIYAAESLHGARIKIYLKDKPKPIDPVTTDTSDDSE